MNTFIIEFYRDTHLLDTQVVEAVDHQDARDQAFERTTVDIDDENAYTFVRVRTLPAMVAA
jgi:hypothetical protein